MTFDLLARDGADPISLDDAEPSSSRALSRQKQEAQRAAPSQLAPPRRRVSLDEEPRNHWGDRVGQWRRSRI